ncbi:MAG: hypothetical protein Q8Q14_13705, partial [Gemmatimonadales bacterium]|nr:hypothetical protein [Gemmatimonadales bacterium]
MKTSARTVVIAALPLTFLAISGCSDSVSPRPSDPLVQQVIAMGFHPDEIVDRGDYFLVEGDIVIRKRDLGTSVLPETPSDVFPRPMFQAR